MNNAHPEIDYFVDTPEYRFFKVAMPAGAPSAKGGRRRKGGKVRGAPKSRSAPRFRRSARGAGGWHRRDVPVRLATPGGRIPNAAFLHRHKVAVVAAYRERCSDPSPSTGTLGFPGRRRPYGFKLGGRAPGHLCMVADLVPGPGGVLTRKSKMLDVRSCLLLHLAGAPLVVWTGKARAERESNGAGLSPSQIGEAIESDLVSAIAKTSSSRQ